MENLLHKILVVDDESIIAMDLQQKLERLGYDVPDTAHSAEEALEKVEQWKPDLVLMDIRLDGSSMNGVEVAERIRQQWNTPLIFLTAFVDDETLQRAKLTEPYGYLVKPFTESELRIAIEIAIHTAKSAALLRLHTRRQMVIAEFSQHALREMRIEVLLEEAVSCITKTLDVEFCSIDELLPDGKSLRMLAGTGWEKPLVGKMTIECIPNTLQASPSFRVDDPAKPLSGPCLDFLQTHGIQSGVGAVITSTQELFGVIFAYAKAPRIFMPDDIHFLSAIANVISQAIQRLAAEAGLQRARDDIERRKQRERERQELLAREQAARQEAERANRAKDEFLAVVSHELRTPLTSIMGWTSLLRGHQLDAQTTTTALETIERQTQIQVQLIGDILDVSRIVTGKLHTEFVPVDLTAVLKTAVGTVQPTADAKSIQIKLLLTHGVGQVWGDPSRLQQILWNLLSNAIKFTPKGGLIEVRLEQYLSTAQISVRDTGQGISPEFLPHVFERFRQADSSSTRSVGGLGLGLAIVRHLVEIHGGTVEVHSDGVGQGSTFTVRFPLLALQMPMPKTPPHAQDTSPEASAEMPDAVEETAPAADAPLSQRVSPLLDKVRVLVVDDDQQTCLLIKTMLELAGAQVVVANSASEAIETLQSNWPDVMVSDIGMPGEDGYSLIRKVRHLEAEKGVSLPAAALTAYARQEDRELALAAGFQFHLTKPTSQDLLLAAITELARKTVD